MGILDPTGITDQELDEIAVAQESFMPDEVSKTSSQFVSPDNYQDAPTGDVINCRITPGYGQFRDVADRYQGITPYTITFSRTEEAKANDKLIDGSGRVFLVRDVKALSSYSSAIQCLCERLEDNA